MIYANKILALIDATEKHYKELDGKLRIGSIQTIAASHLPVWLSHFKSKMGNVAISVNTDNQMTLLDCLLNDELDCIFTNISCDNPLVKTITTFYEKLLIIAPLSCQTIEDAKDYSLVVNSFGLCPYRNTLQQWILKHNENSNNLIEFDTI